MPKEESQSVMEISGGRTATLARWMLELEIWPRMAVAASSAIQVRMGAGGLELRAVQSHEGWVKSIHSGPRVRSSPLRAQT